MANNDNVQLRRTPLGKQLGSSGTQIFNGMITAEEYNRRLQGKNAIKMYDIMRRSEESVRAALQIVKLPLLSVERRIEPASDDPADIEIAAFVESQIFKNRNINFNKFAKEALTFFDFGHSVAEKTYQLIDYDGSPRIGLKQLGFRKQTSIYSWETIDKKPGITQQLIGDNTIDGNNLVSIPREKIIVWTHDQEGDNYEGISLLRYAFKSWDMADKLGLVHAMGLEKMAIPTPVLGVPSSASEADVDQAVQDLQQYRANEKAFIKKPAGWELDKLDMSGQSLQEMLPALQHYERKILLSVLGQFLMLGMEGGSGSRATSEDHSKLFMQSEEAANKTFQDVVQEQLINQLVDINYSNLPNGYPQLKSASISDDDVQVLSDAVSKLKGAGILTPTYETEQHLRKTMRLPELPEDYKDDYEKRRQQIDVAVDDPKGTPDVDENLKKQLDKSDKKTKAAVVAAVKAREGLIDVLLN